MSVITPLQAVIFDVDGTILNTMQPQYLWLRQTAAKYGGLDPFPDFGREFLRMYNDWLERKAMPGLYEMIGVDFQANKSEIWKDYNAFNQTHPILPVAGVPEAIQEIYERSRVSKQRTVALRLAVHTTKSWKDIEKPLGNAGLFKYFDTVVTKDDIYNYATDGEARRKNIPFDDYQALRTLLPEATVKELEKPNSLGTWITVQRLGVDPSSAAAFEDTTTGLNSCKSILTPHRRVSLYNIGVTWGYQEAVELAEAKPDEIIDDPKQMPDVIGSLGGYS